MKRRFAIVIAAVAAGLGSAVVTVAAGGEAAAVANRAGAGGGWTNARGVPGLAALERGGEAQLNSVSCYSTGNCGAGGFYAAPSGTEAFVVAEINGRWGKAIEVPGLGPLNKNGSALVASVSCATGGYCAAGGSYLGRAGSEAFVVVARNGRWGNAVEVPGTSALNKGGNAQVTSVSCASAGNCAAGGTYTDRSGHQQAFVETDTKGRWGTAVQVPGLAALNKGGQATVTSVSCPPAGNCAAAGSYATTPSTTEAFVVSEASGHWGKATTVAGLSALNKHQFASVSAVACASAGACTAAGYYLDHAGESLGFAVIEAKGRWGTAEPVPGLSALSRGGGAEVTSLSCPAATSCAAAGIYGNSPSNGAFVVNETIGRWGKAEEVPGLAELNKGHNASLTSLSCPAAGDCAAGGSYTVHAGDMQAFVVNELNGRWGKAEEVPGTATLNKNFNATVASVSCSSAGHCVAVGRYEDGGTHMQAFIDEQP